MNTHPELIVMLTYNDVTVPQAAGGVCQVRAYPRAVLGL